MRIGAGLMVAAVLLCGLQACSDPKPQNVGDRVIDTTASDAVLNAAMKEARDTLGVFWTRFDAQTPGVEAYGVKLRMTGQDGFQEFIWAEPVSHTADEVIARLANEPLHLQGLRLGSEVRVKKDLIFDWGYERNGKLYGHFTTRALINKMTAEERAQVEGRFSPTPLEPEVL